MRLALPLLILLSPLALAALASRLQALRAKSPPPPGPLKGAAPALRVYVALQAAARARR